MNTWNAIQNCPSKSSIKQEKYFFIGKLELNFRKTPVKCYIWSIVFVVLKLGHFGKQIQNAWKVLNCGAGKEWIRSV